MVLRCRGGERGHAGGQAQRGAGQQGGAVRDCGDFVFGTACLRLLMWAMGVFVEWATRGRTHARWRQRASGTSWLAWEGGLGGGSGSTLPAAARGVLQRGRDAGAGGGVRVFNRKRELFAIPFPTRVIRRMGRAQRNPSPWPTDIDGFRLRLHPSCESRTPGYRSSRVHTAPSSTFTGNFATGA